MPLDHTLCDPSGMFMKWWRCTKMLADNVQKLGSHGMLTKTQMTDVSMFGVVHFIENKNLICITIAIISTPETQFSESQFSEILDLMNEHQVLFS